MAVVQRTSGPLGPFVLQLSIGAIAEIPILLIPCQRFSQSFKFIQTTSSYIFWFVETYLYMYIYVVSYFSLKSVILSYNCDCILLNMCIDIGVDIM